MDLYILRHGIAVERGTARFQNDFERPLTSDGIRKLRRIACAMIAMELVFDVILTSPYVRARQTAERVAKQMGLAKRIEDWDELKADADIRAAVLKLKKRQGKCHSVLMVGHEPNLSTLTSVLISGGSQASLNLKKGGLLKLTIPSIKTGRCAALDWLLTPKQMLLMR